MSSESSESPVAVSTPSENHAPMVGNPSLGAYEFTAEQNELIGGLGRKMKLVGLILLIFGALNLINAFLAQLLFVHLDNELVPADVREQFFQVGQRERWLFTGYVAVIGIVFLCVGAWTRAAGDSFSRIAATAGQDVNHLLEGFKTLHKMYSLIAVALVAAIFAGVVLVVVRNVM